ncbi:hypothetical protein CsSME_00048756 [Camellia sinensis var. sinensis]
MMFVHQPGSGIKSKLNYTSGFFHMNIKLPANDSGGVVTAFYIVNWILSYWATEKGSPSKSRRMSF